MTKKDVPTKPLNVRTLQHVFQLKSDHFREINFPPEDEQLIIEIHERNKYKRLIYINKYIYHFLSKLVLPDGGVSAELFFDVNFFNEPNFFRVSDFSVELLGFSTSESSVSEYRLVS